MRKAPISKMSQSPYDAAKLLADLRNDVGVQRFGLVVQALFAHVLLRLGGNVLDVKSPGHPDIRAMLAGQMYNIEVETAGRKTLPRQLEQGDLDVLQVRGDGEHGYFCVLDCGPPIAWLCVDVASLGRRAGGELRLSLLRGYSNRELSLDCTAEFSRLVVKEARILHQLTYDQLRQEVLSGRPR